jgi:hypothetical protein
MNNKLISEKFVVRFILIELEDAVLSWNGTSRLDIGRASEMRDHMQDNAGPNKIEQWYSW